MGNTQSIFWKISGVLPEGSASGWGFAKKPFADDKDRDQFIHAVIAVITNNGQLNLQAYKFRLLFSRREDDRLVARIVAELDGVIRAKIEPDEDGKDQAEAFLAMRRFVEKKLEKILQGVPNDGTDIVAVAGPSRPPMGAGRPILPMDAPPAYEGGDVKRKPVKK